MCRKCLSLENDPCLLLSCLFRTEHSLLEDNRTVCDGSIDTLAYACVLLNSSLLALVDASSAVVLKLNIPLLSRSTLLAYSPFAKMTRFASIVYYSLDINRSLSSTMDVI
jgi:hypothetical protein